MNGLPERTYIELEAARMLLASLGFTPEDLLTASPPTMPTFADYIPRVSQAVTDGTRRVYSTYWGRVLEAWSHRRLDEPTALEITQLAERTRQLAVERSNSRGGRTAAEHLISALRCVYRYAVADRLISEHDNPASRAAKPRRLASTRRALSNSELDEIVNTAATTGNDPELDTLLLRFHLETACRRGGALALRSADLDVHQCLVRLREKGQTTRWQPISPTMTTTLTAHHEQRGTGDRHDILLRYRNGSPLTARRYDQLWHRIGIRVPWVATQQVSTHWLRHTTLTWVERNFSYATARAYAGHNGRNDAGTTATYVRADLNEIAIALATMTNEPHPLAIDNTCMTDGRTDAVTASKISSVRLARPSRGAVDT